MAQEPAPGDFWRNNDNWMPVLLAKFGQLGPAGPGHVQQSVGLTACAFTYEEIRDARSIRRPIQGMSHSVPAMSGSTVFAREQVAVAYKSLVVATCDAPHHKDASMESNNRTNSTEKGVSGSRRRSFKDHWN